MHRNVKNSERWVALNAQHAMLPCLPSPLQLAKEERTYTARQSEGPASLIRPASGLYAPVHVEPGFLLGWCPLGSMPMHK